MHPALAAALQASLPTEAENLLLRACLVEGDPGRRARKTLIDDGKDPLGLLAEAGHGRRRLAPLLGTQLARDRLANSTPQLARLRTAVFREELRAFEYSRILGALLESLSGSGLDCLVVGGAALAFTVYSDPSLRHSHGIDLLLPDFDRLGLLESALEAAGFEPLNGRSRAGPPPRFRHPSGLPLVVHDRLFKMPYYESEWVDLWVSRRVASHGKLTIPTLSTPDNLHHTCVHASYSPSRSSLIWVCDAWALVQQMPHSGWDALVERTENTGSALPTWLALDYLKNELEASIPSFALAELETMALGASHLQRDVALRAIRMSRRGSTTPPRCPLSLRNRAALGWWRVVPSSDYVRLIDGPTRNRSVAVSRLLRPARWAHAWLSRALRHASPSP